MKGKYLLCSILLIAAMLLCACGSDEDVEYYYIPGDAFVTNVMGAGDTMVKAVITIGMNRDATEILDEKLAVVRDSLLQIIRSTPLEDLQSEYAQDTLSSAMTARLNEMFPPGEKDEGVPLFTKVYFTDLVVQ